MTRPSEEGNRVQLLLIELNCTINIFRFRFEKRIHIGLPDPTARRALLDISLKNMTVDENTDLDAVANRLDSYSGADITNLCRDAAMMGMRRMIRNIPLEELKQIKREEIDKPITMEDFEAAMARCKKTSSEIEVKKYEEWMEKHGSS